jgi:hypothetical protein
LEYRGFRVSDLNKEGTSANADLLAAKDGRTWQIQVKGCTEEDGWWFGYGFCNEAIIARKESMFNHCTDSAFYKAEIVALVCVKKPNEYSCIVVPVEIAEKAAQMNLDREYRKPRRDGGARRPGRVFVSPEFPPSPKDAPRRSSFEAEAKLLEPYRDNWEMALNDTIVG